LDLVARAMNREMAKLADRDAECLRDVRVGLPDRQLVALERRAMGGERAEVLVARPQRVAEQPAALGRRNHRWWFRRIPDVRLLLFRQEALVAHVGAWLWRLLFLCFLRGLLLGFGLGFGRGFGRGQEPRRRCWNRRLAKHPAKPAEQPLQHG